MRREQRRLTSNHTVWGVNAYGKLITHIAMVALDIVLCTSEEQMYRGRDPVMKLVQL